MSAREFHLVEGIGRSVDPNMTMTDIAKVIGGMSGRYPSAESRRLARLLAAELGEVYLDKMCEGLMRAPFWNQEGREK